MVRPTSRASLPEEMDTHHGRVANDCDEIRNVISIVSDHVVDADFEVKEKATPPLPEKSICCTVNVTVDISTIQEEQDSDSIISVLKNYVQANQLPYSSDIADQSIAFKYFWNHFQSLEMENGIQFYVLESVDGKSKNDLNVLPTSLKEPVLAELHNSPSSDHLGFSKTYDRIKLMFIWYGLKC